MTWQNIVHIGAMRYLCGWCDSTVGSNAGYFHRDSPSRIYVCPNCDNPTSFVGTVGGQRQSPTATPGFPVQHLPADVEAVFNEARQSLGAFCPTAAALMCRKLLMNIAVNHGAKEGESFVYYVDHLAANGFVPPNGRGWVDLIRKKGNQATHEIALATETDANELLEFSGMLLRFIYEFPAKVPPHP